jgi:hypothetical protein
MLLQRLLQINNLFCKSAADGIQLAHIGGFLRAHYRHSVGVKTLAALRVGGPVVGDTIGDFFQQGLG